MNDRSFNDNSMIFTSSSSNTNSNSQRTFFFTAFSSEFFDQLRDILDEQHAQNLSAQEALFTQFNALIEALIASIERLVDMIMNQQRFSKSSSSNDAQ